MTDDQATPEAPAAPAAEAPAPDAEAPAPDAAEIALQDDGDARLLALIDRLADLLERSDLTELEVESGGTGLVLRKPSAIAVAAPEPAPAAASADGHGPGEPAAPGREPAAPEKPSVKAPLTGIFYGSPAPGSAPYVTVGGEVAVGQIVGLIEAMKLFNEIKSDLAGRVVKVIPESGTLVKAKQPLVEVQPL
jgi:acetyl-CoA carboxylase biotin carboxyl carrier protein